MKYIAIINDNLPTKNHINVVLETDEIKNVDLARNFIMSTYYESVLNYDCVNFKLDFNKK